MRGPLLVLVACVALAGCDVAEESRLQFSIHGDEAVLRPLLTLGATAGDWRVEVTGEEIGTGGASNRTEAFETPDRGTLEIDVVLARPGEPPLATTSVALEIRRDWIWGVGVFLTDANPADECFGCTGHRAVALPDTLTPETQDSLFVVWAGNSINEPVVY